MEQMLPAFPLPVGVSYLPIPVAGIIMLLYAIEKIFMPEPKGT